MWFEEFCVPRPIGPRPLDGDPSTGHRQDTDPVDCWTGTRSDTTFNQPSHEIETKVSDGFSCSELHVHTRIFHTLPLGIQSYRTSEGTTGRCLQSPAEKVLGSLPAPSNRSPLEAFGDLKMSGGDLLEGAGRVPSSLCLLFSIKSAKIDMHIGAGQVFV